MPTIRDVQLDRLVSRDQNLHGRRIRNASASADPNDYVIRAELDFAIDAFGLMLNDLKNQIDAIGEGEGGGSGIIEAGNVLYQKQHITGDTTVTTIYDATTEGNYLIVVLINDVIGHQIFWDTDKFPNGPINLDIYNAGLVIVCKFVSVEGYWYSAGIPQT